jgi:hypothetical protein
MLFFAEIHYSFRSCLIRLSHTNFERCMVNDGGSNPTSPNRTFSVPFFGYDLKIALMALCATASISPPTTFVGSQGEEEYIAAEYTNVPSCQD